jgi:hypothetical protein
LSGTAEFAGNQSTAGKIQYRGERRKGKEGDVEKEW